MYANLVPTEKWRNAMTLPRELKLKTIGADIFVTSVPVAELANIQSKPIIAENVQLSAKFDVNNKMGQVKFPCQLNLHLDESKDISIVLSNEAGNEVVIGYDNRARQFFIDRTKSGKTSFNKEFAARHIAPRLINNSKMDITLIIDVSSVELFADEGLTVMTSIFFPDKSFNKIRIESTQNAVIKQLEYVSLQSIW